MGDIDFLQHSKDSKNGQSKQPQIEYTHPQSEDQAVSKKPKQGWFSKLFKKSSKAGTVPHSKTKVNSEAVHSAAKIESKVKAHEWQQKTSTAPRKKEETRPSKNVAAPVPPVNAPVTPPPSIPAIEVKEAAAPIAPQPEVLPHVDIEPVQVETVTPHAPELAHDPRPEVIQPHIDAVHTTALPDIKSVPVVEKATPQASIPVAAAVPTMPSPPLSQPVVTNPKPVPIEPMPHQPAAAAPMAPAPAAPRQAVPGEIYVQNMERMRGQHTNPRRPIHSDLGVDLLPAHVLQQLHPKSPLTRLLRVALGSVVSVGLVYAGMVGYESYYLMQTQNVQTEIVQVESEIQQYSSLQTEVAASNEKLETLNQLLSKHVYWTNVFNLLETYTLPNVHYTAFSSNTSGVITLQAVTTDYASVTRQIAVLEEADDFIKNVTISSAGQSGTVATDTKTEDQINDEANQETNETDAITENAAVSFSISAQVQPDIFYYQE